MGGQEANRAPKLTLHGWRCGAAAPVTRAHTTPPHLSSSPLQCSDVPADVFFLADTTGSMGSVLSAIKSGAADIISSLTSSLADVRFGAGDYKDFYDEYAYNAAAPLAADGGSSALAAINSWSPSGGGDAPEAQLFALNEVRGCLAASRQAEGLLPVAGPAGAVCEW